MARKFRLVSGAGSEGNQYVSVTEDGKVKLLQSLDYEAFNNPSFSIRVECYDERGLTMQKNFIINVIDEEEVPQPAPAPDPSQIFSPFGGPCGSPSLPMALRIYDIGPLAANGLKIDSNYVNKFAIDMCSHEINVPNQPYSLGFPQRPSLTQNFAAVWDGQIYAPKDGTYEFATRSDDRAIFYIFQGGLAPTNRTLVIDDDYSNHAWAWSRRGQIFLKKGLHPFQLRYTQQPRWFLGVELHWNWNGTSHQNNLTIIPRTSYFGPLANQMYRLDTVNEPNWP